MKAESNLQPRNKFEIENIINNKCDLVFFDNVQELESSEDNEKRYSYDTYRINANYRDELEQELNDNKEKYEQWLKLAKNTEYNKLAEEVRTKRNELLKKTDAEMCLDRLGLELPEDTSFASWITFLKTIANAAIGKMAKYRQELRDITKQEGFPYNVVFPTKPDSKESEE